MFIEGWVLQAYAIAISVLRLTIGKLLVFSRHMTWIFLCDAKILLTAVWKVFCRRAKVEARN